MTTTHGFIVACVLLAGPIALSQEAKNVKSHITPLRHAHAHNDYAHKRPLQDALDRGFCSVEADVFLRNDQLLIGHTVFDLQPDRKLENLYLEPLRQRVKANNGRVFPGGPSFYLLIDVKTEAKSTYLAIDKSLSQFSDILSVTQGGKFREKAVTVIISGNTARESIASQKTRYAGIDGRPSDLESAEPIHLIPWISASWGLLFQWKGIGPMPEDERMKLHEFVQKAHKRGRLVRFWATPEQTEVWKELRTANVDLINTDKLDDLRDFLLQTATKVKSK